jgi:hypothetical protein
MRNFGSLSLAKGLGSSNTKSSRPLTSNKSDEGLNEPHTRLTMSEVVESEFKFKISDERVENMKNKLMDHISPRI